MSTPEYRWINVYNLPASAFVGFPSREEALASCAGSAVYVRTDRYRVDDEGHLHYDPEPERQKIDGVYDARLFYDGTLHIATKFRAEKPGRAEHLRVRVTEIVE